MITINVSAELPGLRYEIGGKGMWWNGVSRDIYPILLSPLAAPAPEILSEKVGRLVQGPKRTGALRDTEVLHLGARGTLSLPRSSFVAGQVGESPAYRGPDGVLYPFRSSTYWGSPFKDVIDVDWGVAYLQGSAYWRDSYVVTTELYYDGDILAVVSTTKEGTTYRDGVVVSNGSTSTLVLRYLRSGYDIRYLGQTTHSGSLTDTEITALLQAPHHAGWYNPPVWPSLISHGDTAPAAEAVFAAIRQFEAPFLLRFGEPVDFGELSLECAKQMDYVDSNVLLLVLDVADWRNFHAMWKDIVNAKGWKDAYRLLTSLGRHSSPKDLLRLMKPGSQLFLWWKYVFQTTSSDVQRLDKGIRDLLSRPLFRRVHSRKIVPLDIPSAKSASYTATMTVEVGAWPAGILGKIQEAIGMGKRFGVYPELTNLYDLLKYSFVLDWFTKFGDFLQQCQDYLDTENYFPINYVQMSSKWVATYSSTTIVPGLPVTGDVDFFHYHRWISYELPRTPVTLDVGSGPLNHGAEASALILQRVR